MNYKEYWTEEELDQIRKTDLALFAQCALPEEEPLIIDSIPLFDIEDNCQKFGRDQ